MDSRGEYRFVRRWALAGVSVGALLAVLLLWAGNWGRGEAMEAAAMVAYFVALPLALVTELLDRGHYASQWVAFVVILVPANWGLIGLAVGLATHFARRKQVHVKHGADAT